MASWGRAHAIKAALVAGFLLVLLNLFGSRYDAKIDKPTQISVPHNSFQQWPKRTHSSYEINQSQQLSTNNNNSNSNSNNSIINNNNNNNNDSSNKTPIINATTIISLINNSISNNNNNNNISTEQNSIIITILNNINMSTIILPNTTSTLTTISTTSTTKTSTSTTTTTPSTLPPPSILLKVLNQKDQNQNKTINDLLIINNNNTTTNENSTYVLKMKTIIINNGNLEMCPIIPPNLDGPIIVNIKMDKTIEMIENEYSELLEPGGWYHPKDCKARDRVAIIVPYRDRAFHIPLFLKNLHPFLMKQQIDYGIFIIEQAPGGLFNRAMLMNIGFVEALKLSNWDCFVFHDVDLLPMDDRNLYTCPDQPRHMSAAVDTLGFKLPYSSIFGGVSAMTVKQFQTVNGFSNSFWGWGGEDDDMSNRLKRVGYHIARYPVNIARYTMLTHKKEKANPKRYEKLVTGAKRYDIDGLNSLTYKINKIEKKILYTLILTEIKQYTGS